MRFKRWGKGLLRITIPIMENQMEKKTENEVEIRAVMGISKELSRLRSSPTSFRGTRYGKCTKNLGP